MVNMDRLASRLRQDAQCLAPDLQKLMPDVEYDDATFGSICAAGDAYRKSLWLDPRSEEHTSETPVTNAPLVFRLLLVKKQLNNKTHTSIQNTVQYTQHRTFCHTTI